MEFRQRASHEQFQIILDFMETNGDLSRPQPGAQGRARGERLWHELAELVNSVGGSGVQKPMEKWKRVWSDWKTKIRKKASLINRDNQGTGGGPSRARPLNPLEERVLQIIGTSSITGHQEVQEAGFEAPHSSEIIVRIPSPSQPAQPSPPVPAAPAAEFELPDASQTVTIHAAPVTSDVTSNLPLNIGRREDAQRSPSAGPSTPRRRRVTGQRRRRHQTPFEQATSEFVRVEEGRLRLEEMRILRQHERDMEQLRVESQRNEILQEQLRVEYQRNEILQRISDTSNNIMELLLRSRFVQD